MKYSLVPGTNQLTNLPGYGSQLFSQYGYNIDRPRYRDYYNMLRGNQGLQFADSLAQLLTKIWPTGPHATGTAATVQNVSPLLLGSGSGVGSASYNPASLFNTDKSFAKAVKANESGYTGFLNNNIQQWPGRPDPLTRLHAYHELLRHVEHWDRMDRDPRYFITNNWLVPNQSFEVDPAYVNDPNAQQPAPEVHDNIFMAHKKLIIGVVIAIVALVLYTKLK